MTSVSLTDDLPAAPRGPSRGRRAALAFLLGLVVTVGTGGAGLAAFGQAYAGRVLPGVTAGGVDLAGLSPDAARRALEARWTGLAAGSILLRTPAGERTIGYAEIGRAVDAAAMVDAALALGRGGAGVGAVVDAPRTALRGAEVPLAVALDEARLADALAAVAATVDEAPRDAALSVMAEGTWRLVPSRPGRALDRDALAAAVRAALADPAAPGQLVVDAPLVSVDPAITTPEAVTARAAAERMAVDLPIVFGEERWDVPAARILSLVRFAPTVDGGLAAVVDVGGLEGLLETIRKDVDQLPRDARYLVGRDGTIVGVEAAVDGRTLDVAATRSRIVDALMGRQDREVVDEVQPAVAVTPPALTTEEAEATAPRMVEISRWRTYFPISEKNGFGANIWIPSTILDGYVVKPGATFDFLKAIGPITRDAGYLPGGAIIDGRTDPQGALAGGICSCSTTLFNAAMRAGFKMGARRNHYYYIDRYPVGLDATVFISSSGSVQTMSWTNDTAYPVLIRGINTRSGTKGWVTFVLYSVPTGRVVELSEPVIKNVRPATDTVEYTSSLPAGTRKRLEFPVDGMEVWVTRTVTRDGVVIHRNTWYSRYARMTGLTLIGTGGSSPAPTATPAATPAPSP